jgi:hypothetical protein
MPRPLSIPGKDLVPIVQVAGWAPGPVWIGAEIESCVRLYSRQFIPPQLHVFWLRVPVTSSRDKATPILTAQEDGWAQKLVWTLRRRH